MNNLALLYRSMGRYAEAEPLYRQPGDPGEALGEDHPDYAASLNNLAALYQAMGGTPRPSRSSAEAWRSREAARARTTPTTPPA